MTEIADRDIHLRLMTWPELKRRLTETDIALIPTGQTEQHARHLPLDTDNVIAAGLAEWVAHRTYHTARPVVAPVIPFGYSDLPAFSRFPGTFTIEPPTLIGLYRDVAASLIRMGFSKIVFINAHCPNPQFIQEAVRRIVKETGAFAAAADFCVLADDEAKKVLSELGRPPAWGHACLVETSVAISFGCEVREGEAEGCAPGEFPSALQGFVPVAPPGISIPRFEMAEVMEVIWPEGSSGSIGNPKGFSAEIGQRVIAAAAAPIIRLVEDIRRLDVRLKPGEGQ